MKRVAKQRTPEEKNRLLDQIDAAKANGQPLGEVLKQLHVPLASYYTWRSVFKRSNGKVTITTHSGKTPVKYKKSVRVTETPMTLLMGTPEQLAAFQRAKQ